MPASDDAVWRDIHRGRVWRAQACRIVAETVDVVALWIPAGSPAKIPGGGLRIPGDEWELVDAAPRASQLCVARPGRAHSVYVFWNDAWEPDHWYVNFEQPLRRSPVGFDTFDEKLDLIVQPDGSHRWKDEDELEQAASSSPSAAACSTRRPSARRRRGFSRSGRSLLAGRIGGPIRPGLFRCSRRAGTRSDGAPTKFPRGSGIPRDEWERRARVVGAGSASTISPSTCSPVPTEHGRGSTRSSSGGAAFPQPREPCEARRRPSRPTADPSRGTYMGSKPRTCS